MEDNEHRPDKPPESPDHGLKPMLFAGLRLGLICASIAVFVAVIYMTPALARRTSLGDYTVSLGFLVVAPACASAVASLLADPKGKRSASWHLLLVPSCLWFIIMAAGVLFFKEGILCVFMATPLWLGFSVLGSLFIHTMHKNYYDRTRLKASLFAGVAALATLAGPDPWSTSEDYIQKQSIIIDATPEQIWPHLESMKNISEDEGRWTFTQNILQVPRPVSAVLIGEGTGAIRYATWGENIRFEEHIIYYNRNEAMEWAFVFPDDSLQNHTDRHIDPDGRHLKIARGGYRLEPLHDGRTRLTLHTAYQLDTQMNAYPALWSRLMLGDLQANILEIVKARAESD